MKMISGVIVAMWLLVAGTVVQAVGAPSDWVLVDENPVSSFYYDRSGITTPQKGIIRVMTRVIYTEEGKAETLETLKPATGYEKLYESRFQFDLNCKAGREKLLRVMHLDKSGTPLKVFELADKTDWEDIPRDARISEICETELPPGR